MILQKSKLRQDLIVESSKEVPNYDLKNSIPEFNKENEIAIIVKLLLPKKLRPSLLSSTIVSQIRMTQAIEQTRKKEVSKNKQEIQILMSEGRGRKGQDIAPLIVSKHNPPSKEKTRMLSREERMCSSSLSTNKMHHPP